MGIDYDAKINDFSFDPFSIGENEETLLQGVESDDFIDGAISYDKAFSTDELGATDSDIAPVPGANPNKEKGYYLRRGNNKQPSKTL